MLPLQQAFEVKYSLIDYLKATFSFNDKSVHDAFYSFINDPLDGIFKGPYISLKLPFVKSDVNDDIPLDIQPNFPPYNHQLKAFQRLTTKDNKKPQSTLITTGTSSGKTECFLYPILDFCHKNLGRKGIKVIILYPMNALATDQAKRLAEAIHADSRLRGKITAGLFIGEGKEKKKFPTEMGEHNIIENRQTIVDNPPDIILTNFKMIDYALMRNTYHNLWSYNLEDPTLLQFLILDELHTYDGAQGTDVANLIRRLKLKLNIQKGQICPIGTSATIGSGEDSKAQLIEYAEKVYGEDFGQDSLISEHRISVDLFFGSDQELEMFIPRQISLSTSRLSHNETYPNYIDRQKSIWQLSHTSNQVELGEELKKLKIVKDIAYLTHSGIRSLNQLIQFLADINDGFRKVAEWDAKLEFSPREEIIHSLLALISEAKSGENARFPFLFLQVQLWIRELSGVLREFNTKPKFIWRDSVGGKDEPQAMPAYYCRECGASGWLGVKDDNKNNFSPDPLQVYEYFFSNHKNTYFINTKNHPQIETYAHDTLIDDYLDIYDLSLSDNDHEDALSIHAVRKIENNRSKHICPECNTENTLGIIGTRVATLSSITISQVLASDLDPREEKYRKILAFTNSVQDAAHQAGFIEARNYRFTFRTSLQKVINAVNEPISLAQLQTAFLAYWKEHSDESHLNNEEAYYYRFLPEDYKGKVDLTTDYRVNGQFTAQFKREFDLRMKWEIISEFGYNALIGRTLEKSEASAVKFDELKMQMAYSEMKDWIESNIPNAIEEEEQFLHFLNGILHRIRVRGGIDHEYMVKFRELNQELREINWWQDNRHFLNRNFGSRSRLPKLITNIPHHKGMLDTTHSMSVSWFRRYFAKSFKLASDYPAIVNDFYSQLLDKLVQVGLMNKVGSDNKFNYAIIPDAIFVENEVKIYECDECSSQLHTAKSDTYSENASCLDYRCSGHYRFKETSKPNYYQAIYNRTRSPRIRAAEHTGILERKDRENKEIDFKERPRFNSLNAIVATSTLEMGIDIGTLNTAINNSIPPLTSNYLQRIGRAGRSSGSALLINFAQNKPHDLFYFNEPSDMMEGEIATPACFIEAKDILFRHFFAFCLDKWSSTDPAQNSIPRNIYALRLLTSDIEGSEFFINRIISFIKSRETLLLDEFCAFYKEDIHDSTVFDQLREYLFSESLYVRLKQIFVKLKNEYHYLISKRNEIDVFIKENQLAETDKDRLVLLVEKKALWGMKRQIDQRSLLEHLTNVGLLPNYAFPETGVTLNAWVKNAQAKESTSIPTDMQFEIVRPASSAIRELAPENYFYSQGFKLEISGLNTHDWREDGVLMQKRFCSNCDHIETEIAQVQKTCPKCGDGSWSATTNVHTFVKLSGVKSFNFKPKSTLDDRSDERDTSLYTISRHLKFDNSSRQGAWGMKEIPFGIEYVKNVSISHVNVGLSSSKDANKVIINNLDSIPHHGFITCKFCGKSTSSPHKTEKNEEKNGFHYRYCNNKSHVYAGKADSVFEEVFLFREISTEAIKILLPVQEMDGESKVNLFKAGLDLGLKRYYKGNPQHLSIIDYKEYNEQNSRFDKYLVIHDNVSGGTGYLEKLFNPAEFTKVLQLAYEAIKDCSCKEKGKDGCYRCIYTYANQRTQKSLSRSLAEKLFEQIIQKSDSWESFTTGLGKLSGDGKIEESELEERFIRSLKKYVSSKKDEGYLFEEIKQNDVVNYTLQIRRNEDIYSYFIRPQHELGETQGVSNKTRSDFYITLTGVKRNGVSIEDVDSLVGLKDIAVYLDGYTYHATKENFRFLDDVRKRESIMKSGSIMSWTLTWQDVELFDETDLAKRKDELAFSHEYQSTTDKLRKPESLRNYYCPELFCSTNSIERLIWYLKHPLQEDMVDEKVAFYLLALHEVFGNPSCDEKEIEIMLEGSANIEGNKAKEIKEGKFFVFPDIQLVEANCYSHKVAIKVNDLQLVSRINIAHGVESLPKESWGMYWRLYNLTQSKTNIHTPMQDLDSFT